MALFTHLTVRPVDAAGIGIGDLVRAGAAGAVWRVGAIVTVVGTLGDTETRLDFALEPVDQHDVPLAAHLPELPLPRF